MNQGGDLKGIDFVAFPVMAAIFVEAGTVKELSHRLLLPMTSIRRRLKLLERKRFIAKRSDGRWIPIVSLAITNPLEDEKPKEEPVLTPPEEVAPGRDAEPPPEVRAIKSKQRALERRGDAVPKSQVSGSALKVSKFMKVPSHLKGFGEARMGSLGLCGVCQKSTPLHYGGRAVCPICARGGK